MRNPSGLLALLVIVLWAAALAHADPPPQARAERESRLGVRPETVLLATPSTATSLQSDVAAWAPQILERYGEEEWKATLLTHEFHHHLGIYSLVGAKMGVRARELLGASVDQLRVESQAGLEPPLSCLNDGLQVGSGATLGRGSFRVHEVEAPAPRAVFAYDGQRLELSLRPGVQERIRRDVAALVEQHGRNTTAYFDAVRELSLRYWAELDRREIFEERRLAEE